MNRKRAVLTQFLMRNLIIPAIDFIYSPICFHCQRPVASGMYMCDECDAWLQTIPYESDLHVSLRGEVLSHCKEIRDVYALYDFQPGGVLQTLIHDLKYQQKTKIGVDLGKRLGRQMRHFFGVDDSWVLIPVPLHPVKGRERGYNQAYYIARGVQQSTGARIDVRSIARLRKTRSQTKLTMTERKANVSGAFVCTAPAETFAAQPVAIIDDVITTGVTISEIVRILPEESRIYAFSLGHAPMLT